LKMRMSECHILTLPKQRTTSYMYGLESIKCKYKAIKYWNLLSDGKRTTMSLKDFKKAIIIKET